MIKIAQHKIQKYGTRGYSLSIPAVFINDNRLDKNDYLEVHREIINGEDVLILKPVKSNGNLSTEINQTEQAKSN